jgi:D-alanyl-D-alanine carboxypeptidase
MIMREADKEISYKAAMAGIGSALLICGLFIYLGYTEKYKEVAQKITDIGSRKEDSPFEKLNLEAKSVIVYDVKNKRVLYEKNSNKPMPLASITKVMTALVATESLAANKTINVPRIKQTTEEGTSSTSTLMATERWKYNDLINYTLLVSSNPGAVAVADAVVNTSGKDFSTAMNDKARELQLNSMVFSNPSGLDLDPVTAGGYGSAKDVADLFAHVITTNPKLLEITRYGTYNFSSLDDTRYIAKNTDIVVGEIPGMLASKTGYTNLAGGNLVIAFDAGLNRPIVIVVLGSTYEGRFTDILSLASTTLNSL